MRRALWSMFKLPVNSTSEVYRPRRAVIVLLATVLFVWFWFLPSAWSARPGGLYGLVMQPELPIRAPGRCLFGIREEGDEITVFSAEIDVEATIDSPAQLTCSDNEREWGFWAPVVTFRTVEVHRVVLTMPQRRPSTVPFPARFDDAVLAYIDEHPATDWLFGASMADGNPLGRSLPHASVRTPGLDADGVRNAIANGGWEEVRVRWWGVAQTAPALLMALSLAWLVPVESASTAVNRRRQKRRSRGLCVFCAYDLRGVFP